MNASSVTAAAAENNASWCETFCRSQGIPGEWSADFWYSKRRAPKLYPDAVTIRQGVDATKLLARVDASDGCSIKDSYCDLALMAYGFNLLFDAEWLICRRPEPVGTWTVVRGEQQLREWEAAWGDDQPGFFHPSLLDDPCVCFVARLDADGHVCAGAVANRAGGVLGLTNLFEADGDLETAWRSAATAAQRELGHLPVVAYSSSDRRDAARLAGFDPIGPLRVWILGAP